MRTCLHGTNAAAASPFAYGKRFCREAFPAGSLKGQRRPGAVNSQKGSHSRKGSPPEIAYEAVTVHFDGDKEPLRVSRVQRLAESRVPGSGERALWVVDAPSSKLQPKGSPQVVTVSAQGFPEMALILIPPEEIDFLLLETTDETREASVEEALEGLPA